MNNQKFNLCLLEWLFPKWLVQSLNKNDLYFIRLYIKYFYAEISFCYKKSTKIGL